MQTENHSITQNLLLVNKLLDARDSASPFTLAIDTLEQPAKPLIKEYVRRAKKQSTQVLYISFTTPAPTTSLSNHFVHIAAHTLTPTQLTTSIQSHLKPTPSPTTTPSTLTRTLLIFDTLHPLLSQPSLNLPAYLSNFLGPTTSLLAIYHIDQPLPFTGTNNATTSYAPSPLTLLTYLATTIFYIHNFDAVIDAARARGRSLVPRQWGLEEGVDGLIKGLHSGTSHGTSNAQGPRHERGQAQGGMVVEMEHRRRSGRSVYFTFVLSSFPPSAIKSAITLDAKTGTKKKNQTITIVPLQSHHSYVDASSGGSTQNTNTVHGEEEGIGEGEVSFKLSLTERQKREREGVALPYYDAQSGRGPGEGGRILYDLGEEDDFDEEEDEI